MQKNLSSPRPQLEGPSWHEPPAETKARQISCAPSCNQSRTEPGAAGVGGLLKRSARKAPNARLPAVAAWRSESVVQLIVVELGAEWPQLSAAQTPGERRVLVQDDGESPAAFAARVGKESLGLLLGGQCLGDVIMACNERLDEQAQGARAELAFTTANALAQARGGSLLLSVSDRNAGRSRPTFSALRSDLGKRWQGAAVETRLCFGDELTANEVERP